MESSGYRALQTRELEVLLRDVVQQRMGDATAKVLDTVVRLQACSLYAVCQANADQPENQVRHAVAALLKHEAVAHDEPSGLYSASFGTGILPAFFPLIARFLTEVYHHAAGAVALTLFEYHDLPFDAIARHALRLSPGIEGAVRKALELMRDDEILVPVGSTCPMVLTKQGSAPAPRASGVKRPADGDTATSYQLNWPVVLAKMRAERIRRFVAHTVSPTAEKVLTAFLSMDSNQPSAGRGDRGFPKLHQSSSPQSAGLLQRRFPALQPSAIISSIEAFTTDPLDTILIPAAAASAADPAYSISFVAAVRSMQRQLLEGIVLARHGLVGSRIVKLLAENEAMEDRFVAEEALITHAEARTTLAAMLREGFVKLLELPKGSMADRVPKHSIFLWTINKDQQLETLQTHVVKALTHARVALAQELADFRHAMPPSYFVDPANTILSQAEARAASRHEAHRAALQHAVVALLERALVALFF